MECIDVRVKQQTMKNYQSLGWENSYSYFCLRRRMLTFFFRETERRKNGESNPITEVKHKTKEEDSVTFYLESSLRRLLKQLNFLFYIYFTWNETILHTHTTVILWFPVPEFFLLFVIFWKQKTLESKTIRSSGIRGISFCEYFNIHIILDISIFFQKKK